MPSGLAWRAFALGLGAALLAAGCVPQSTGRCQTSADCVAPGLCVDGICTSDVVGLDAGPSDAGPPDAGPVCSPQCPADYACTGAPSLCTPTFVPAVQITAPQAGSYVRDALTVTATARAPGGVRALFFDVGDGATTFNASRPGAQAGETWSAAGTIPPLLASGDLRVLAEAIWDGGTESSVPITLQLDRTAPVVSLRIEHASAPRAGVAEFWRDEVVLVRASASDSGVGGSVLDSFVLPELPTAATPAPVIESGSDVWSFNARNLAWSDADSDGRVTFNVTVRYADALGNRGEQVASLLVSRLRWVSALSGGSLGSPALGESSDIFLPSGDAIWALRPDSGQTRWNSPATLPWPVVYAWEERTVLSADNFGLFALSAATGLNMTSGARCTAMGNAGSLALGMAFDSSGVSHKKHFFVGGFFFFPTRAKIQRAVLTFEPDAGPANWMSCQIDASTDYKSGAIVALYNASPLTVADDLADGLFKASRLSTDLSAAAFRTPLTPAASMPPGAVTLAASTSHLLAGGRDGGGYNLSAFSPTGVKSSLSVAKACRADPVVGRLRPDFLESVFVGCGDALIAATISSTALSSSAQWTRTLIGDAIASAAIGEPPAGAAAEVIYQATGEGYVYAVDAGSGTVLWAIRLSPSPITRSPALAGDGTLYVSSLDSKLYAVITDSPGLSASARWPKYRHDNQNTGNATAPLR